MSDKLMPTSIAQHVATPARPLTREQMTAWLDQVMSRRRVLAGATGLSLAALAGTILGGCGDGNGVGEREGSMPADTATAGPAGLQLPGRVIEHGRQGYPAARP